MLALGLSAAVLGGAACTVGFGAAPAPTAGNLGASITIELRLARNCSR